MGANGRFSGRSREGGICFGLALILMCGACSSPAPLGPGGDGLAARGNSGQADEIRFTGTVDLVWPGGKGMNAPDDERIAQATIVAFQTAPVGAPGPGEFTYRVLAMDGSLHREIGVKLRFVHIDVDADTIRFLGEVISDTKPCGGSGHGDGSHDDGGCSHDDGGGGDDGGMPGGPGGPGGGHVTGADCRIGQVVIGWAQDGGTPGPGNDRISWKWFAPDAQKVLDIEAAIAAGSQVTWPCKLCEKEIIGGNLGMHGT
ncbi:MAG: hypothetical protein ACWGON_03350 [Gemmatimonadota bacterium]